MISATGVAFAIYPVSDIARARAFYADALGLPVCMEMEFSPGLWWIEYDIGGPSALAITNFKSPNTNGTPTPGIAVELANYDETLASLRAAGVPITWGPNDFPVCHCFAVKDPDGNDLYFHKRKASA